MTDLPIHDTAHVRQAMVDLGRARGMTDLQRVIAIDRILRAAYKHGVETLGFIAALVEGRS